jgi:DNA-binding response OmpR family regulator
MHSNDNPIKILVISRNPLMADFLESVLDPKKYQVSMINPTPEEIANTRRVSPDLFVIDELDSKMDVLKVCEKIRQYSGMPIMVLSSVRKAGMVEQVLDAGADEYLTKPVPGNLMIAHLNTLARRAKAEKDAALSMVQGESESCGQLGLLTY